MLRCRRPALFDEPIPLSVFQEDPDSPPSSEPVQNPSALRHILAFLDGRSIAALVGTCTSLAVPFGIAEPSLTELTPWKICARGHVRARVETSLGPLAAEALANGPTHGGASGWLEVLDSLDSWRHMRASGAADVAADAVLLDCMRSLQREEVLASRVFPARSL